jgi:hypothetical protein
VTNYRQDLRRAVQQREARTRWSNDECGTDDQDPDCLGPDANNDYCGQRWIGGSDEEDDGITPLGSWQEV